MTQIENAHLVTKITAHYMTPSKLIRRTKEFTSAKAYLGWERSVERMGYTIDCLDIERKPVEMKTVRNLMSGKEIEIAADTPLCCDPSSETYWSM